MAISGNICLHFFTVPSSDISTKAHVKGQDFTFKYSKAFVYRKDPFQSCLLAFKISHCSQNDFKSMIGYVTLYLNIFNCLFREQIWVSYPIHPLNPNSFPSIECPYSQCPDPQSSNPAPEKDAEQLKAVATFTLMISLTSTVIGARLKCALSWGNRMHLRTLS